MKKQFLSVLISSVILAGCQSQPSKKCASVDSPLMCSTLTIADIVSTQSSYPAVLTCADIKSIKVLSGDFYWNGEGPFNYSANSVDAEQGTVQFKLRTRNAGLYKIESVLKYQDASGCRHKTKRISAGFIQAK